LVGLGSSDFFYTTPEGGDNEAAKALVQTMYDAGGRLIDTPAFFLPVPPETAQDVDVLAESIAAGETPVEVQLPVLGTILQELNLHNDLFLVGKVTVNGAEAAAQHLDRTMQNLGRDQLDVMLLHNLRDLENTWPVLEAAKAEGKVRYIGVSEASDQIPNDVLEDFMVKHNPDFIMPSFSMYRPSIEERILPMAADMGTAVVVIEVFKTATDGAYFNVTSGLDLPEWAAEFDCESWAQFSLKFVLSHPAVTCAATETSRPEHILDNMGAGYGRLPDQATRVRMQEFFNALF
jgi:aryl-alcohol dehydrogenase-like predicted oxidoreductase